MYEVELKVRADHDAVRDHLPALDAERLGSVTQHDTYYDAPHRSFVETGEALRVRRIDGGTDERAKLSYKGPLVGDAGKVREERESGVESADETAAVLEALGFTPAASVEKDRKRHCVERDGRAYEVVLDTVAGLGEFVEVETAVTERDGGESAVADARAGAAAVLAELDLDPDEEIRTSYLDLLVEAGVVDLPAEGGRPGGDRDEAGHPPTADEPRDEASGSDAGE